MELLEFEHEALTNIINVNSLTISSKGLLNDRLLFNICTIFSKNCHLLLVINANDEEEIAVINQINLQQTIKKSKKLIPKILNDDDEDGDDDDDLFEAPIESIQFSTIKYKDREKFYLNGGVKFITTRILLMDMLTKRIPFQAISGIVVMNAHKILTDSLIQFILCLFRTNNKTGFITALSQDPTKFLGSFNQLENCMKKLFVSKLFLWPRFKDAVIQSFNSSSIKVFEYMIEMTPTMKAIQFIIMDLIENCVKNLRDMKDIKYFNAFDSLGNDEDNKLSTINAITTSISKLFYNNLDSIWYQLNHRARRLIRDIKELKKLLFDLTDLDSVTFFSKMKQIQRNVNGYSSDWLYWNQTNQLFELVEERVHLKTKDGKDLFNIEINPKLDALMNLLQELEQRIIDEENQNQNNDNQNKTDIIIIVKNHYSRYLIEQFRDKGRDTILEELKTKCELILKNTDATELEDQSSQLYDHEISMIKTNRLYQIHYYQYQADFNGLILSQLLSSLKNLKFIILYEPEMCCIRKIELYQALNSQPESSQPIEVFYFMFEGSASEQCYLRNLQREKQAFVKLIEENSKRPNVIENDGIIGEHSDLIRGKLTLLHPEESLESMKASSSRTGGFRQQLEKSNSIVLVDTREFRSSNPLPYQIYKIGIDLEPVQLDIGDYILTPDCCVERKTIQDLIKSFNDGRLYSQTQSMVHYYKRPLLLIEFSDDPKSFNFKSKDWGPSINSNSSGNNNSIPNPLVQLAILTIHFPLLRLIWSPKPQFSADLFLELKKDKEEPDSNTKELLSKEYLTDNYDFDLKDFLLSLPGITSQNFYKIMNKYENLLDLVQQSLEDLTKTLESEHNAKLLYSALHDQVGTFYNKDGNDGLDDDDLKSSQQQQQQSSKRFTFLKNKKKTK